MATPERYCKRPVEIEAMQLDADNAKDICDWMHSVIMRKAILDGTEPRVHTLSDGTVLIMTLDGDMTADLGDWVIREPFPTNNRFFYPCKPEIFMSTYEQVE